MPSLKNICSPALLYLILSVLSIITAAANKIKITTLIVESIFILLWTWFLNWLCVNDHTDVAWFLVILPFVIMMCIIVIASECIAARIQIN
jgi:hypothetical protein